MCNDNGEEEKKEDHDDEYKWTDLTDGTDRGKLGEEHGHWESGKECKSRRMRSLSSATIFPLFVFGMVPLLTVKEQSRGWMMVMVPRLDRIGKDYGHWRSGKERNT